ncbi:MAG: 3-dehydroquinate synthase [Bacilli bacterium]|nr:3-dehydroquinate synthase [Bacilli bacterium]
MDLLVKGKKPYKVLFRKGSLAIFSDYFPEVKGKKAMIITDSGVPTSYIDELASSLVHPYIFTFEQGEKSKNIETYQKILHALADNGFTRDSYIITLGGGVVGDLGGFVASTYMRGISWINIPSTLLSEVDSSIGGKTAIDYEGYKNIVGAFYNPHAVLINVDLLKTLDVRQVKAGLVEAIKMAATFNKDFFEYFEKTPYEELDFQYVVYESLKMKQSIVEKDPEETHLRKSLNFGHTIGHALEKEGKGSLLHGEAVALGMLLVSEGEVHKRIKEVFLSYQIPIEAGFDEEIIFEDMKRDKKKNGEEISLVLCPRIGEFEIKDVPFITLKEILGRK